MPYVFTSLLCCVFLIFSVKAIFLIRQCSFLVSLYGKCQAKRVHLLPQGSSPPCPPSPWEEQKRVSILISITQLPLLQRAQWHSLLSTKYTRLKPELKLMLSLEDDTQPSQSPAGKQQQTQQADEGK